MHRYAGRQLALSNSLNAALEAILRTLLDEDFTYWVEHVTSVEVAGAKETKNAVESVRPPEPQAPPNNGTASVWRAGIRRRQQATPTLVQATPTTLPAVPAVQPTPPSGCALAAIRYQQSAAANLRAVANDTD